jgi:D-alanine-D-alanine ligase
MNIGITYDLKADYLAMGLSSEEAAEFDKIETIDAIDGALKELGFQTVRIGHAHALLERISKGERWDAVFNICEGLHGIGREAQVPAILDLFQIPYVFSDPMVLALCLHKGMTKRIIRDLGLATPAFAVISKESEIKDINLPYPLFAKPVAEGTGKGITGNSCIKTKNELAASITEKLLRFKQPVLVETFLPGREFTVGVVGTAEKARSIGLMECHFRENVAMNAYSYDNKSNYEEFMDYSVPTDDVAEKVCQLAVDSWRGLNCRDGGRVDIRLDADGIPNFIEVNPLAGLHPIDSDLVIIAAKYGHSYTQLIQWIMDSAMERINENKKVQ